MGWRIRENPAWWNAWFFSVERGVSWGSYDGNKNQGLRSQIYDLDCLDVEIFIVSSFFSFEIFHDGNKDESKVRQECFRQETYIVWIQCRTVYNQKVMILKKEVFLIPESRFRNFWYLELMIDMFRSVSVKLEEYKEGVAKCWKLMLWCPTDCFIESWHAR